MRLRSLGMRLRQGTIISGQDESGSGGSVPSTPTKSQAPVLSPKARALEMARQALVDDSPVVPAKSKPADPPPPTDVTDHDPAHSSSVDTTLQTGAAGSSATEAPLETPPEEPQDVTTAPAAPDAVEDEQVQAVESESFTADETLAVPASELVMETKPSMNGVHVEPAAEDVQEEVAEEPAPMSQAEDQIATETNVSLPQVQAEEEGHPLAKMAGDSAVDVFHSATEQPQSEGVPPPTDIDPGNGCPSDVDGTDESTAIDLAKIDVAAIEHAAAAPSSFVELGSPMKDPSSLFGAPGSGSNDPFAAFAQPQDSFAEVRPVGYDGSEVTSSQDTPAVQVNPEYTHTPNVLPPSDLFGESAPSVEVDAALLLTAGDEAVQQLQPSEIAQGSFEQEPALDATQTASCLFDGGQGEIENASALFDGPPVAPTTGGDVSNLFGPPTAMPDIFGAPAATANDPFGSIGANHEASFFDSLAAAPVPEPVVQVVGDGQNVHGQAYGDGFARDHDQAYAQYHQQPSHYSYPEQQQLQSQHLQTEPTGMFAAGTQVQIGSEMQQSYYQSQQAYSHPVQSAPTWTSQQGHSEGGCEFEQIAQPQQQQQQQPESEQQPSQQQPVHTWGAIAQDYGAAPAHEYQTANASGGADAAADYGTVTGTPHDYTSTNAVHNGMFDQALQGQTAVDDTFTQIAHQQPATDYGAAPEIVQQESGPCDADLLQQGVVAAYAQGVFQQSDESNDADSVQKLGSEISGGVADDPPYPWQAHVDPNSGCIYYFNTETGMSTWEPPARDEYGADAQAPTQDWMTEMPAKQLQYDDPQHALAAAHAAAGFGQTHEYPVADDGQTWAADYGQMPAEAYGHASGTDYGQAAGQPEFVQSAEPAAYQTAAQTYNMQRQQQHTPAFHQDVQSSSWVPPQQQQQQHGTGTVGGINIMMPGLQTQQQAQQQPAKSYGQEPMHQYAQQQPAVDNYSLSQPQAHIGGQAMQNQAAQRRPPCPVMCFGMGGVLIVAMPGANRSVGVFTGNASELDRNRPMPPPPVAVYALRSMASQAPLLRQLEAFPGPLSQTPAGKKALKAYTEEQIQAPSSGDDDISLNPGSLRLLWSVLDIMVDCSGDLSAVGEIAKVPGTQKIAQMLQDPNLAGDQFLNGGGAGFGVMGMAAGGVMDPANRLMPVSAGNDVQAEAAAQDMQALLVQGKREEACKRAIDSELWAPALMLSSYINMEMYQTVMGEFARKSFRAGTPLRTLYMLFAGQGKRVLDSDSLEALLDAWQANLSVVLNNRTPGDSEVVVEIGEGLWRLRKDVEAAHVCMMLAGEEPQPTNAPTCRMTLIGADHRAHPTSFCSAAAIQRTEVWEHAAKLKSPKKDFILVTAYKLHHAMLLAESGATGKALAYVEQLCATARGGASRMPPRLVAEIEMFDHRLRQHMGGKAAAGASAFKGSFLGGLRKVLDTAVSSAIYGSTVPANGVPTGMAASAPTPAPPSQAPSDKLKAIQANAAEKERQALERKREAEEKKRAEKEAKEAAKAKKAADKAKAGGDKEGEDENKGFFSRMFGSISGEKQVDLGEDNTMYYNDELGCWVERGKEHEVQAQAVNAPPPTMAAFGGGGGTTSMASAMGMPDGAATPSGSAGSVGIGAGTPLGMGGGMGGGTPGGGNMFARQARTGARSRYVDTLNPNANDSNTTPASTPGGPGLGKPKPQYKIFVPQAQASGGNQDASAGQ